MFIEFPELLASIYVAESLGRHAKSQGFPTLPTEMRFDPRKMLPHEAIEIQGARTGML